jgi:hypothetical protein
MIMNSEHKCEFCDYRGNLSSGKPKYYKEVLVKVLDGYERIDKIHIEIEGIKK